jgi:regulator of cell morphogenesis and NO signaling
MPILDQPVGVIAIAFPGASRVFHRHRIDYCCGGARRLDEACRLAAADPLAVRRELDRAASEPAPMPRLHGRPLAAVIDHILVRYHQPLKLELPRLDAMAAKVAAVHGDRDPRLAEVAAVVARLRSETEIHLRKEEEILFPRILSGAGSTSGAPIACLRGEHDDHGANLRRLHELTDGYRAPDGACGTWRALLLGLEELERELMEHISLENNLLFPRAFAG